MPKAWPINNTRKFCAGNCGRNPAQNSIVHLYTNYTMTTTFTNTFQALSEAKSSLNMAKTALKNAHRMSTLQFGETFVSKRIQEAQASVERWTSTVTELESTGTSNKTPVFTHNMESTEKSRRKAAKKASKRENILRGTSQPTKKKRSTRKFSQPRPSYAERQERQADRELLQFEKFQLKDKMAEKLSKLPRNQGLHIGGILHIGEADVAGDPNKFSFTKIEEVDNKPVVFEYVSERCEDGYIRESKYHNGTQLESFIRRSPFGKLPRPIQRQYTHVEEDFPVLEKAVVISHQKPPVPKQEHVAPESQDPSGPSDPSNTRPEQAAQPETTGEEFTTVVSRKKAKTQKQQKQQKQQISPEVANRLKNMPQNVGMFVQGKIFWGKKPKTRHNTKTATKLAKYKGKSGIMRYSWNKSIFRIQFKENHADEWIVLKNKKTNGELEMREYL